MSEPVTYDVSADTKTNEQAVLGAILEGRPLAIHDSGQPDVPSFTIGFELSRVIDPGAATGEPLPAGRCQLCQQTRPLFEFTPDWEPWELPVDYQLCARCWSRADSAQHEGDPLELDYLCRTAKRETDALAAKALASRSD